MPTEGFNSKLESKYDHKKVEERIRRFWEAENIYAFNRDSGKEIFSIDTPPPTISGFIHLGHIYSYTQADFIARYKRMRNYEVFYPFGLDDNGLPSELLVEKNQHVTAEALGREKFIELVQKEVKVYENMYKTLWHSVGISTD